LSIVEDSAPVLRGDIPFAGIPLQKIATATPVAQGEETLSVTVSVTWAIKQGQ